jgi:hypothetical protein
VPFALDDPVKRPDNEHGSQAHLSTFWNDHCRVLIPQDVSLIFTAYHTEWVAVYPQFQILSPHVSMHLGLQGGCNLG